MQIVGMHAIMSYTNYDAAVVWQRFMPRRKEVSHTLNMDLYSIQVFSRGYWEQFNPSATFTKWVGVPVSQVDRVPIDMDEMIIPAGLYAVFTFVGNEQMAPAFFEKIYGEWLPNSIYDLDDRPHFEILGTKYKRSDPTSEETVWIPIKLKNNVL
ncbi:MAG: GyrI-like domain-containing protein [Bacteroidetes bacterium]|nr:GyrI-like domain-containing protein [Bacteroidota bacterium]